MLVEQFYTSCLSQASYYIESNGEAAVVDPSREISHFLEKANKSKSTIKYIFQTHFHADFVSGHLTLSKISKCPIVYGPNADPKYECIISNDGDIFEIGDVKIKVIHTPGHTLESTSYLLFDQNNKQHSIFTGDTLFLGDVGIPDVAQRYKGLSKQDLAGLLYDSINMKIKPLDDTITVYPGHGAGSACGKSMMKETVDLLSNQKVVNYSLNGKLNKDEFVQELTQNLPDPPPYFPSNVKLNQEGYSDLDDILKKSLKKIDPINFKELMSDDSIVLLDTRKTDQFVKCHLKDSIYIGLDGRFAPWVGEILKDINTPIVFICELNREREVITRLSRIGFDNCLGYISVDNSTNLELYQETNSLESIDPKIFIKNNSNSKILDVRTKSEYNNGSFKNAINIPLNKIDSSLSYPKDKKLQLFCAGGYRSVIACSILLKNGYTNLVNVEKGYSGIKKLIS